MARHERPVFGETYRGVPLIWNVFYDITDIRRSRKELEERNQSC